MPENNTPASDSDMQGILAFIKLAEQLKNTPRFSFTSEGKTESAAEHSWRLCLLLMACGRFFPELDLERCFKIAIIHDLAEAECGDIPAIRTTEHKAKAALEREAIKRILEPLPEFTQREMMEVWEEYESGVTNEALLVKALDKLETLIQHNQGLNPPDFDYDFNVTYGLDFTGKTDFTERLRKLVDVETKSRIKACCR